uniref:Uncharacterized protein n=1 Tax=Amorphochlora amoebiformis TaxID=1561963 RepID=A0A7S0H5S2_9EUKA|mmetsp:Transcript_4576/g.6961  ORF Transcript_4576/g.6961 Transcript_4576/m.6961 type:complete len:403 (+) Transcript_4576:109-1317(+)
MSSRKRDSLFYFPRRTTPKKKPPWDDSINDLSTYKLTNLELELKRRARAVRPAKSTSFSRSSSFPSPTTEAPKGQQEKKHNHNHDTGITDATSSVADRENDDPNSKPSQVGFDIGEGEKKDGSLEQTARRISPGGKAKNASTAETVRKTQKKYKRRKESSKFVTVHPNITPKPLHHQPLHPSTQPQMAKRTSGELASSIDPLDKKVVDTEEKEICLQEAKESSVVVVGTFAPENCVVSVEAQKGGVNRQLTGVYNKIASVGDTVESLRQEFGRMQKDTKHQDSFRKTVMGLLTTSNHQLRIVNEQMTYLEKENTQLKTQINTLLTLQTRMETRMKSLERDIQSVRIESKQPTDRERTQKILGQQSSFTNIRTSQVGYRQQPFLSTGAKVQQTPNSRQWLPPN